jgi:hypothetical protein
LDVEISFSPRLSEDEEEWAFDVCKMNMEEVSDAFNYFYYYKTSFLCLVMDSVPP